MEADQLESTLRQFTGTAHYSQLFANLFLTDGAVYLADTAHAWWLMDVYASYLLHIDGNKEAFTCLKITVADSRAMIVIDDGNGMVIAKQKIEYTDFPLNTCTLYGCWTDDVWVVMLPSEY